jgi:hypothetical protein
MTNPIAPQIIRLSPKDNVAVAIGALQAGEGIILEGRTITAGEPIPVRHKIAVTPIAAGAKVVKYGLPIGTATQDIPEGCHVHTHNLKSDYLPETD